MTERPPNPGIGGAAIAAIVGKGRSSPYAAWAELTGKTTGLDRGELPEFMVWGNRLEASILAGYAQDFDAKDLVPMFDKLIVHPSRSWQVGHPDGDRPEAGLLVEAKNVGQWEAHRFGETGTDQVPDEYLIQVQWYLSLMDREAAHLAGLFGGNQLKVFTLFRNRALEELLLERGHEFWTKHVLADVPPPMDAGPAVDRYIRHAFPVDAEPLRPARPGEVEIVRKLAAWKGAAEKIEHEAEIVENILKVTIADAAGIEGPDFKITHKKSKDSAAPNWEAIAREYERALGVIGSGVVPGSDAGTAGHMASVARGALAVAKDFPKKVKKGSRRFLPSGPLFKEGEADV